MPTLEIVRCAMTLAMPPPLDQYGWVFRGVATFYCLPFRSPGERERFVGLLADHVTALVSVDAVDTLAALLCLARTPDEAAYSAAVACLEREFATLLSIAGLGEFDDAVDGLLATARGERTEDEG